MQLVLEFKKKMEEINLWKLDNKLSIAYVALVELMHLSIYGFSIVFPKRKGA